MTRGLRAADGFEIVTAGGIATIRIARPAKKNALTKAMWTALAALVEALTSDPDLRVLVLCGDGGDFCAGADIGEFDTVRKDVASARSYEDGNVRAFAALARAPLPTIAAIRGVCFGGGFGLAASCDLRVASPDARFRVPPARLGLAYPHQAMSQIVHALGPQMARYLAYSAAIIDAKKALASGFLLEVDDDPETRAVAIAKTIAGNAPLSIRASKASIAAVLDPDPGLAVRAASLGDATFDSEDYAEGRAAFRERREPVFTGR